MLRTRRIEPTRWAVQVLPWPVGRPIRLRVAAMSWSDQRVAMLRMTARASSEVLQSCSPVQGLRRRSSECCPPFQWMISTISCAGSSTSTTMSLMMARTSCWRDCMLTLAFFHAASRSSATPVEVRDAGVGAQVVVASTRASHARTRRRAASQLFSRVPAIRRLSGSHAA